MKKVSRISVAVLIGVCIGLLTISSVFADSSSGSTWADPVVTGVTTGETFSTTILDTWQLPGIVSVNGQSLPTGYSDEYQFGGKGVKVSGLTEAHSVNISFSFPVYSQSWTGKVYSWDGSAWKALTTTITTDANGNTTASVHSVGNGTYSLLMGFYGTPDSPTATNVAYWGTPSATSSKAGVTVTTNILQPWQLPGTETNSAGMYLPVGFNEEAQFGGDGLSVKILPEGAQAKVCMAFPTYTKSWDGKIYEWNGSKWVAMPTTITTDSVTSTTSACTNQAGDGVYSLIMGYYGGSD